MWYIHRWQMSFTPVRHYIRNFLGQKCPRWLVMMNKNRAQAEVVVIQTSAPCASPLMLCVQSGQFWCGCSGLCVYALTAYVEALKHMFSRPSMPVIKMFKHRKWTALAIFSTDMGVYLETPLTTCINFWCQDLHRVNFHSARIKAAHFQWSWHIRSICAVKLTFHISIIREIPRTNRD